MEACEISCVHQGLGSTHLLEEVSLENHIKSSSILVMKPSFNAKIRHFGTSQLCGETEENKIGKSKKVEIGKIVKVDERSKKLMRSDIGKMQFAGVSGYMSSDSKLAASQRRNPTCMPSKW
ncbi:hypothetical protein SLEP1_g8953 [Rubroshorea leprosula]|uniref:Uncharacterized protein n=1 Tax=Rubroshorea leprosula TaxID=152421 RepID=A0AAV5I3F0_9ROSI|nr:hypothetical protein SLEP1_g8953 [Rubroshorea leprosula]